MAEKTNPDDQAFGYAVPGDEKAGWLPEGVPGLTKREEFAKAAMIAVMGETQEMRVASAWDWFKYLLQNYLLMSFLTVKYKEVKGVYNEASARCVKYADALIEELNK
jgi:hypothetical protein